MRNLRTNQLVGAALCSLAVALIGGCNLLASSKPLDQRVLTLFGGQQNIDPVVKPARVEAFRVASARAQPADAEGATGNAADANDAPQKIADWPITAGPLVVDAQTTAELSAILTNPDTYLWDSAKGCEFDPGVALRFTDDAGSTEILLCFSCDEMAVARSGKRIGGEDTDNARKKLVAIAKRLFPDDATIQALDKP
jgi:hypothetical protein